MTIKKDGLKAAGLVFGTNMIIWGFDHYILNAPYARIDINTIKSNFRTGFEWDNDSFVTNLFTHPVHGGIYFNAVRDNGFNFWQSIPFTAGGSLMWELCMENQAPSINDFISTTVGGACLGEITYRITDRFIDDRAMGFDRFKREAMVFLISPTRGINRLLNGESWKHSEIRGNSIYPVPVTFYSSLGYRVMTNNFLSNHDLNNALCFDLGLDYGSLNEPGNEKPYDFFYLKVSGCLFSQQPLLSRANVLGMLYSWNITFKKTSSQLVIGIFQHFNYYQLQADINNELLSPYMISEAASVGPGIVYKSKWSGNITFSGQAHLSGILLGGCQTDHYRFDQRDYNMGSGFSTKMGFELQFGNNSRLFLNSEDYRIYSWTGNNPNASVKFNSNVQGDIGNASLSVVRLGFNYIIDKHILLGTEMSYYYLKSMYEYYPTVKQSVTENKLSVGYIF